MRTVQVHRVHIDAWATIGQAVGIDVDTAEVVVFALDHRPARHLGEAIESADEPVWVELEDWQILRVHPPVPEEVGS
jgi:hypothetical protein